jgi:1,4-dihydroxy-2-naphthoate octaprenyltransferase
MMLSPHSVGYSDSYRRLSRLPRPLLWVIAARLKTLSLSMTPVLAGSWLASQDTRGWSPAVLVATLIAACFIQIGTNLWNDAADAERGADQPDRLGPPRLTAMGLLSGRAVRRAAAAAFLMAMICGLWLTLSGGWPLLVVGAVSLALGYFYSMGPMPFSYTPLGEALVVLFFGVVAVCGTAVLHGLPLQSDAIALGFFLGLPAAAVLLVNNHRDRAADARAGRRTLAILLGPAGSQLLYVALVVAAPLGLMVSWPRCSTGEAVMLVPVVLGAMLSLQMLRLPISPALNGLLALTAAFQLAVLAGLVTATRLCV